MPNRKVSALSLNHINIVIRRGRGRSSRGRSLHRLRRFLRLRLSNPRTGGIPTPVILHLLVQFLLCLARTAANRATTSILSAGTAVPSTCTSTTASSGGGPLTRDVAVNVIWGRLGDVTAAGSTTTSTSAAAAAASVGALGVTCGADWSFDTVEEGAGGLAFAGGSYK